MKFHLKIIWVYRGRSTKHLQKTALFFLSQNTTQIYIPSRYHKKSSSVDWIPSISCVLRVLHVYKPDSKTHLRCRQFEKSACMFRNTCTKCLLIQGTEAWSKYERSHTHKKCVDSFVFLNEYLFHAINFFAWLANHQTTAFRAVMHKMFLSHVTINYYNKVVDGEVFPIWFIFLCIPWHGRKKIALEWWTVFGEEPFNSSDCFDNADWLLFKLVCIV